MPSALLLYNTKVNFAESGDIFEFPEVNFPRQQQMEMLIRNMFEINCYCYPQVIAQLLLLKEF